MLVQPLEQQQIPLSPHRLNYLVLVLLNFHLKDINDGDFCVLGAGTIDFKPIFEAILGIEYDGWISTDEESGADLVKAMESCLQYMKDGLS